MNLASISDEDCLASADVATAMVIMAMKYAFDGKKIVEMLPKFKDGLKKMDYREATCLIEKIKIYLEEYIDDEILKELDMAFVSIGQKYGFVSAGDVRRNMVADARMEGRVEGESIGERNKARKMARALKAMGDPTDKIVAVSGLTAAEVEAL